MKKFMIIATFSSLLFFLLELTIIRYADAAPINLSLNPNTLAVANSEYQPASWAIDGDPMTGWNAGDYARPAKHYVLTIDIGDVYPVNRIVLNAGDSPRWSPAFYIDYMLLTSMDNINWDTIVAFDRLIDSADGYLHIIDTGTTLMRYVKFEVIGGTHWAHLAEMEIWGESDAILAFFDNSVADGTIYGRGDKPCLADYRLRSMREMLETANCLIEADETKDACKMLNGAFKHCDGEPKPTDSVEGEAVTELADRILVLIEELGCE